ncbi:unnamed protein product [Moneuplotes crassus]|uniref:Pseudouridine synthase RsuA/RluA-like domain-containing protein n=2 Tax=Euplotes crassus TaxID=5936 RepID=A0AAD1UCW1_EUPCR|nr:unnamed protein product [Moneuplotes crassus]
MFAVVRNTRMIQRCSFEAYCFLPRMSLSTRVFLYTREQQIRLDRYIQKKLDLTYGGVHRACKEVDGDAFYVETVASNYQSLEKEKSYRLQRGDKIYIDQKLMSKRKKAIAQNRRKKKEERVQQTTENQKMMSKILLFENDDMIGINKPNSIASQGGDGIDEHIDKIVNEYMKRYGKRRKSFLLHRLDQYASGAMILGKNVHYARSFNGMMREKRIKKNYIALGQGLPNYLLNEDYNCDLANISHFLSGMIRSDPECHVYDHNILNPKLSLMSDQMRFLFTECQKLQMFEGMPEHKIIDDIAEKRCTLSTIYQILGFALYDRQRQCFFSFNVRQREQKDKMKPYAVQEFLDTNLQDVEAYTLYELEPLTGKKHQLRKHLSSVMETPILGDSLYGYSNLHTRGLFQKVMKYSRDFERQMLRQSIFLHSKEIKVPLQAGKNREIKTSNKLIKRDKLEYVSVSAPNPPEKFDKVLEALGLYQ